MCRICARNGIRRDGGRIGLCWQHARRRCDVCGEASAGERTCTACAHNVDAERWKAHSNPLYFYQGYDAEMDAMRAEKLLQCKQHLHEAVEVLCRAFLLVVEAVHGAAPAHDTPDGDSPEEFRKAA